ncbi:MAG: GNAT family N-acetyltransferase [Aphanocapsa lilacina HA4352-LM1]|nr:GNAT family N-acetyltransferase [Aphanocapsa lilacina HA4352-LM1]
MNQSKPSAPQLLAAHHRLEEFDCAEPQLNTWLKQHAMKNHEAGASRTFVVCRENRILAYYCLAMGAVSLSIAPGKVRRNMPDPIPVAVIGRLAVDRKLEGQGYGKGLVKDAVLRVIQVSEVIGVRAILVHAISERAGDFYLRRGFLASPVEPLTLMLPMKDAVKTYAAAGS